MQKPRNTALTPNYSALFGRDPDFIEQQEARGQQEAVVSESLPSDIRGRHNWEKLGFTFGKPFPDDYMFCPATLPPGWKKVATDHSMWTNIVDPAGNVRGMFFYKAAFYDRSAHLCAPLARFEIRTDYDRTKAIDYKGDAFEVFDRVCNTVIFSTELVRYAEGMGWAERDVLRERALNEARDWLDERFPDWERPFTYWDSP